MTMIGTGVNTAVTAWTSAVNTLTTSMSIFLDGIQALEQALAALPEEQREAWFLQEIDRLGITVVDDSELGAGDIVIIQDRDGQEMAQGAIYAVVTCEEDAGEGIVMQDTYKIYWIDGVEGLTWQAA